MGKAQMRRESLGAEETDLENQRAHLQHPQHPQQLNQRRRILPASLRPTATSS